MSDPDSVHEAYDELGDARAAIASTWADLDSLSENVDTAVGVWLDQEISQPVVDVELLADVLYTFRQSVGLLRQIESLIESKLADILADKETTAGKYLVTRSSGRRRTDWDDERLSGRVVAAALADVPDDPVEAAYKVRDWLLQAARPSWRITSLTTQGVDFDDLYHWQESRRTVRIEDVGAGDRPPGDRRPPAT